MEKIDIKNKDTKEVGTAYNELANKYNEKDKQLVKSFNKIIKKRF